MEDAYTLHTDVYNAFAAGAADGAEAAMRKLIQGAMADASVGFELKK